MGCGSRGLSSVRWLLRNKPYALEDGRLSQRNTAHTSWTHMAWQSPISSDKVSTPASHFQDKQSLSITKWASNHAAHTAGREAHVGGPVYWSRRPYKQQCPAIKCHQMIKHKEIQGISWASQKKCSQWQPRWHNVVHLKSVGECITSGCAWIQQG